MKRRVMILLVLVVALSAQGCVGFRAVRGSGRAVEETHEVSDFTGVELATVGNLYIEMGDKEQLRIEAEDNLLRYFDIKVRNGTLEIDDRDNVTLLPSEPIYFYVTMKELDSIDLSGVGHIEVPDLEGERLSVTTSGLGDVEMEDLDVGVFEVNMSSAGDVEVEDLNADTLEVDISGLGSLHIAGGTVGDQNITISSAANYRATDLESARTDVDLSGVGSVTVRVRDHLKVDISGAGSVRYAGSPTVEQDVSGVGHVEKIGD